MPELPEVETVRRGLLPAMEGRVIERAEVRRPDLRFHKLERTPTWPLPLPFRFTRECGSELKLGVA